MRHGEEAPAYSGFHGLCCAKTIEGQKISDSIVLKTRRAYYEEIRYQNWHQLQENNYPQWVIGEPQS